MPQAADEPLAPTGPHWATRLKQVLIEAINSWIDHRASSKGAALAFYTLFSMMPILILAIAIAGYVFGTAPAHSEISSQLQSLIGPTGAEAILALLQTADDPAAGLIATLFASALFMLAATSVFAELKGSLDELWGIDEFRHPPAPADLSSAPWSPPARPQWRGCHILGPPRSRGSTGRRFP